MVFVVRGNVTDKNIRVVTDGNASATALGFMSSTSTGLYKNGNALGLAAQGNSAFLHSNGTFQAVSYIGNGSLLTGVASSNASSLTEGTLSQAVLPSTLGNASTLYLGNGSLLVGVNASNASLLTEGIVGVARGGTGVSNSTGSGSVTLNTSPTLQGNVVVLGNVSASSYTGNIDVGNIEIVFDSGGSFQANVGNVTVPSYSFDMNSTTGLYLSTTNTLGFVSGGIEKAQVSPDGLLVNGNITANYVRGNGNASLLIEGTLAQNRLPTQLGNSSTSLTANTITVGNLLTSPNGTIDIGNIEMILQDGGFFRATVGNATVPGFSFDGNTTSGLYLQNGNTVVVTTQGIDQVRIGANRLTINAGSATAPSLTFAGNTTTGMYLASANILGLSTAGTERMRIDATGNVSVSGNVIAKGIVRNIYHQANTTNFASITTSYIDGPIFDTVNISANSKVKAYVYIPWRNNATTSLYGGLYVDVQFRVNQNVGSYVANSWVSLGISGYQMITGAEEMLQYANDFYLPFSIPTDFTLQFKYRVASYDGTASIGTAYNNYSVGNVLLAQFGISDSQFYPKIIITEIGG